MMIGKLIVEFDKMPRTAFVPARATTKCLAQWP